MSNKVSRAFCEHKNWSALVSWIGLRYNAHNAKHSLYFLYALRLFNGHHAGAKQLDDTQYCQPFWLEKEC